MASSPHRRAGRRSRSPTHYLEPRSRPCLPSKNRRTERPLEEMPVGRFEISWLKSSREVLSTSVKEDAALKTFRPQDRGVSRTESPGLVDPYLEAPEFTAGS